MVSVIHVCLFLGLWVWIWNFWIDSSARIFSSRLNYNYINSMLRSDFLFCLNRNCKKYFAQFYGDLAMRWKYFTLCILHIFVSSSEWCAHRRMHTMHIVAKRRFMRYTCSIRHIHRFVSWSQFFFFVSISCDRINARRRWQTLNEKNGCKCF